MSIDFDKITQNSQDKFLRRMANGDFRLSSGLSDTLSPEMQSKTKDAALVINLVTTVVSESLKEYDSIVRQELIDAGVQLKSKDLQE